MQNQINLTFGKKALTELPNKLKDRAYSSLFILVDEHTQSCCLEPFLNQTRLTDVQVLTMGAGEENKQLETCEKLWHQLSELGADRNSALLNLGGGVVTDLGGFVACTFKRGIDFYNIPTSLLAMVDASLGGKTGIDLGLLKNQI
jgi:3-dehydroquinate synthase